MAQKKSKVKAPAKTRSTKKTAPKAAKKTSAKKVAKKTSATKVSAKPKKTQVKTQAKSQTKNQSSKKAAKPAPRTTVKKVINDAMAKVKSVISNVADSMTPSKVGTPAPAIALQATGGKQIDLASLKGKNVVLYFYPKDDTPGCTLEGQDFTRLHKEFKAANTEVFGVSRDSVQSHDKFKAKQNYSIDLLSDSDEKLCNAYGVIKMKNMYGKKVRGIERSTFVLDANGNVAKEWRKVSVPGHAEEVLNFVKSL